MTETPDRGRYDLEERTYQFAETGQRIRQEVAADDLQSGGCAAGCSVVGFGRSELYRSQRGSEQEGFPNANSISRKESKETRYWLRLLDTQEDAGLNAERDALMQESTELMKILSAILHKSE